MAFRVQDAKTAYSRALELGAQPIDVQTGPMELKLPAIKGIGGVVMWANLLLVTAIVTQVSLRYLFSINYPICFNIHN
mgnify:CR=1 FL=1